MALRQSDDTEVRSPSPVQSSLRMTRAVVRPYFELETRKTPHSNDALIAHGIIPPRPKSPSPEPLEEPGEELLDEDDLPTSVLEAYRAARLQEIKGVSERARFGRVYPIQKVDYTREVTEASREGEEGTGIVCFLYKDAILESRILGAHLARLAKLYPSTKFVSIVGDMCIENYPDRNIPTLLIYRGGELVRQVVGLSPMHGLRGQKTSLEDVEKLLVDATALDMRTQSEAHSSEEEEEDVQRSIRR